ncbi:MAG TPA: hypothetical protein VGU43_07825, partial [Thermoplasmata archaeon]|nr:hypothetical protein [Thermoplasmata archaeon]
MAEEPTPKPPEPHMLVYPDRVVLDDGSGTETTFFQGPMSQDAKNRYAKIQQALEGGWLDRTAAPAL